MDALRLVTLLHVTAGTFVLVVAPIAMLVGKGGRRHRRAGLAFCAGMIAVLVTAAGMWQSHGHLFLLFLDAVSAYLVFVGYRTIVRRRRRLASAKADVADALAAVVAVACALALATLAAAAHTPLMHELAVVLAALAILAATFAALDAKALAERRQSKLGSLLMHLSAMIGAYISAVTAFVVINAHGVPMTLRWLVPSVVGTAVIGGFSIAYRRRFARARGALGPSSRSGDSSLIPTR